MKSARRVRARQDVKLAPTKTSIEATHVQPVPSDGQSSGVHAVLRSRKAQQTDGTRVDQAPQTRSTGKGTQSTRAKAVGWSITAPRRKELAKPSSYEPSRRHPRKSK